MILAPLLLQAATAPVTRATAAPPASFSILTEACAPARPNEVVVCGSGGSSQRLPLPADAEPTPGYVKPDSRDYRDNKGGGTSCAARMEGCTVGFGPPIMPVIVAGVKGVKNALQDHREAAARRRDGARRVPIALDDPSPAGRVLP